ncbi:MAG TPA: S8 family serine peptidase [Pyrinomonadaceae bacterium]|nr:S8 family serine peptidase [Pyrinomonadaceae bacterium]
MRSLLSCLALTALLLSSSTPASTSASTPERIPAPVTTAGEIRRSERPIPDHYIVVLNGGDASQVEANASQARADASTDAIALAEEHGGTVQLVYEHALRGFSVEMSEKEALALSRDPRVAYVEEDSEFEVSGLQPSAPAGLDRIDQRDLPLDTVYAYPNGGANAHVYVIDSGIRITHQEFGGRATVDFDLINDGQTDCHGHGTHIAGIVGGSTYGVAKGVRLHSVRVFGCTGTGPASQIISGVDWVTGHHAGASVALLGNSGTANTALDDAVRAMITSGVTTVIAAGNNGLDAGFRSPARVTEAVTVGAVDSFDTRTTSSNFGSVLDLFAPGAGIVSADWASDTATATRTGTSMAAAFTAGSAALYLHVNPSATPAAVAEALNSFASAGRVINPGTGSPNFLLFRPSGTGRNGKVAFIRDMDVWVMNADGTSQVNLTNGFFLEDPSFRYGGSTSPTWSPDGTRIAFALQMDEDGRYIYTINADGSGLTRVNSDDGTGSPAWSPDGLKIAFQKYGQVCTINTDGSGETCLTQAASGASWSPDGTKFAFSSSQTGDAEIYTMNVDGTGVTRLTFSSGADFSPEWSPDGRQLVFQSQRDGNDEIYVMNVDGSAQARLTNNTDYDSNPSWSPDGTRITYGSYAGGTPRIWAMKPDGRGQTALTSGPNDSEPAWQSITPAKIAFGSTRGTSSWNGDIFTMAADGSGVVDVTNSHLTGGEGTQSWQPRFGGKILFVGDEDGDVYFNVYLMNVDGTNRVNLTNNLADNEYPTWSPDGSKIGYVSTVSGTGCDLYVANADGTNQHALNLSPMPSDIFGWDWSPDGTKIVFEDGNGDIAVVNADGTGRVTIVSNAAWDWQPRWSPDGSKIVFTSDRTGSSQLYVMNPDGTAQTQLTSSVNNNNYPVWSPNGRKIAFISYRNNDYEIYSISPDGTQEKRLTNHPGFDYEPHWSSDGAKIVFYRYNTNGEEWTMNADGTAQVNITNNAANDYGATWQPR